MPCADVEMNDAGLGGDDIDDGIDGSDLMEVNVIDGDVVNLRLGVAEQFEGLDGERLDGSG